MRPYLYFTVFFSGMITLAAEISASRLLGSVFGTSNLVWASIIGLILIYLTLGYFIGGRWADRSPMPWTMYTILAWSAFSLGIIPFLAQPVLRAAAEAFDGLQIGILLGSFTAILVLFSIPITLLGMISPFAIRISMRNIHTSGNVAGDIYALSTLGSFVGTFLPVLVLIPLIGTTRTFLTFSVTLLIVSIIGLWLSGARRALLPIIGMFLILAIIAVLTGGALIKNTPGQIYETESSYNYIQVIERDGFRYLRLNEGQGVHSVYHPEFIDFNGPWEQFLVAPFFNSPPYSIEQVKRIAIIGLAAGTTARQATAVFGPVPIDGYEIDPVIVDIARKYFDMNQPNLNVIVADGRWALVNSPYLYDIIAVDAYRPPYIPWHMTTQEFFQAAAEHLTKDGVLAINVGRAPEDRSLINGLATTISTVLPSVYVVDIPGTFNSLIYATRQQTRAENLASNLVQISQDGQTHPLLVDTMQTAFANLQPDLIKTTVFTDDLAPIEWITNNMILNFVLFGNWETLQ